MPILGATASAIAGSIASPSFYSIATINGDSTTTAWTFSSIPQTYKHLQIRFYGRSAAAVSGDDPEFRFNGLSSGYSYMASRATDGNVQAYSSNYNTGTMFLSYNAFGGANAGTTRMASMVVDIANYTSTTRYKQVKSLGGRHVDSFGSVHQGVGLVQNLSAITSIYIGLKLATNGTIALYGIK